MSALRLVFSLSLWGRAEVSQTSFFPPPLRALTISGLHLDEMTFRVSGRFREAKVSLRALSRSDCFSRQLLGLAPPLSFGRVFKFVSSFP